MKYAARFYQEDGSWLAEIRDAGKGGLWTQGETLQEAREMARDAVTEVLLSEFERELEFAPGPDSLPGEGWEWVCPYPAAWASIQIRSARRRAGLTVAQAASACGVAAPTYVRWEDPYKSNATLKTLDKVAGALGRRLEVSLV